MTDWAQMVGRIVKVDMNSSVLPSSKTFPYKYKSRSKKNIVFPIHFDIFEGRASSKVPSSFHFHIKQL